MTSWRTRFAAMGCSALIALNLCVPVAYASQGTDSIDKDETVYVYTLPNGEVRDVQVRDRLVNEAGAASMKDRSSLDDIEVEGDDATIASQKDGDLVWTTGGKDVQYKGASTQDTPVSSHVSYWLDGVPVKPSMLAGATGHVRIRVEYTNNEAHTVTIDGKEETIYTPFVALSIVTLDHDVFQNIAVTNGRVLDGTDATSVMGYAMPGLQQSLNVDAKDLELPSYIEIEADATDFELDSIVTVVTPELMSDMDTEDLDTSDLTEARDGLSEAMGELVEGTNELANGMQELSDGQSALASGIEELRTGVQDLPDAAAALAQGATAVEEGVGSAKSGADALANGSAGMTQGLTELSSGLASGVQGVDGLQQLLASASSESGTAATDATTATTSANSAVTKLESVAGVSTADVRASQANALAALMALRDSETLSDVDKANVEAAITALEGAGASLDTIDTALTSATDAVADAQSAAQAAQSAATHAGTAQGTVAGAQSVATQVGEGLGAATTALGSADDANTLIGGSAAMGAGAEGLSSGLGDLESGAGQVADGLGQVSTTLPKLLEGIDALAAGASALDTGTKAAADGSSALAQGVVTFNDEGIQKLIDKLDESGVASLGDRLEALVQAARDYTNFSGLAQGQTGSVRFVFKTDAI